MIIKNPNVTWLTEWTLSADMYELHKCPENRERYVCLAGNPQTR